MGKTFVCSLCRNGIIGGGLYIDEQSITYSTQKLTVSPLYRNLVLPMNEIRELSWSQMVVPVAAISMKDGECYKFIIYNKSGFEKAMDDDFNTADAIAAVFDFVKFINTMTDEDSSKEYLENLFDRLVRLTEVLGIIVDKEDEILDSDIEALIAERQAARKEKNFARADEIRDELLAKGIVLKDTREGVQWKRA